MQKCVCHSERSEESGKLLYERLPQILHFVQNDTTLFRFCFARGLVLHADSDVMTILTNDKFEGAKISSFPLFFKCLMCHE